MSDIGIQIYHASLGLLYLHSRGLVHGDLKAVRIFPPPSPYLTNISPQLNILIDDAGNAVLCDFGLSRIKADTTSHTTKADEGSIVGSRNWMAPERLLGGILKKPSDIYALGMTIYEASALELLLGPGAQIQKTNFLIDLTDFRQ